MNLKRTTLFLLLIIFIGASLSLYADTIKIHNETDFDLYGATYYFKNAADRYGEVQPLFEGTTTPFARPPLKFAGPQRKFVFSLNKDLLKPKLTSSEYHILGRTSIGLGSDFYIASDEGGFKAYNTAEWKISRPLMRRLRGLKRTADNITLGVIRKNYSPSPAVAQFQTMSAQVRESTKLPLAEQEYRQLRAFKANAALEKLTGVQSAPIDDPIIALCTSGGGYRAMLGALGTAQGAQDTGLLDAITYISALSGSTWFLGPWIQSGWSLDELRRRLVEKIKKDFFSIPLPVGEIVKNLLLRLSFKQPVTALNMYGRMLGYNLLSDIPGGPFNLYLSEQADKVSTGELPFPIYTAITTKLPYEWIEFTPYEVGSDYLGGYIPIWSFGAPFLHGQMKYFTPPYSLAYILAICGSAFSARLHQTVEELAKKIPFEALRKALTDPLKDVAVGKYRVSAAEIFNWTYGMHPLPRAQQEILKIVDGGISFNLGLEALFRRKANIIIIADFSAAEPATELRKAEADLRGRGYELPPIDYRDIDKKPFSVFKDSARRDLPVIIYIPIAAKLRPCLDNWCGTFKFDYTAEKSALFIDTARKSLRDAAPAIIESIKQWRG